MKPMPISCDDSGAGEHIGILARSHQGSVQHATERADPDTLLAAKLVADPAPLLNLFPCPIVF